MFDSVLVEAQTPARRLPTAAGYQITAIPIKVIINPKGQIVFNKINSLNNVDLIAEELAMMIELAKNVKQ